MSAILRTSKFVRYFAGVARTFTLNVKDVNGTIIQQNNHLYSNITQRFATAVSTFKPNDANLDRSLQKIDQDVRRSGRISKRDIEELLEEIRHTRTASSSQSLLVIRCCGNLVPEELPEVRTLLVKEIWRTLNRLNVQMDVSHYNALLRVYLENEHQFSPTEFLADMESKGIEPNRVTYQRLISQYCHQGDIEGATRILEFMREKQLPVSENVFNALVMGHSQVGDMDSAKDILSVMGQAGLEPSADTYTALMCGYARKGDIEAITTVLNNCESKDIYLLDKDYMDIIFALTVNGHKDKIDTILNRVKKSFGYNHDAVNIILRLINKGHDDVGLTIMKTMVRSERTDNDNVNTNMGAFFIRQLVKTNKPVDTVLKVCKELEADGTNPKAVSLAVEYGLQHGNVDTVTALMQELKKSDAPIRHHYFWPLICREGRLKNDVGVLDVLKLYSQFDLIPNGETLRDYVYDNLQEKNPHTVISMVRSTGLSEALCSSTMVMHLLSKYKLKEASQIANTYRAYHSPYLIRRPLNQCLVKTGDIESYIKIVHQVQANLERREAMNMANKEDVNEESTENEVKDQSADISKIDSTGLILTDLTILSHKQWSPLLDKVLSGLVEQGLGISNHHAEGLQERLGDRMTPELSSLLSKLSSGDLEPVALKPQARGKITQTDQVHMENLISALEKKGEHPKGLQRQLLTIYCRNKELEKLEALVESLKKEEFVFSCGIYAQIMETYVHFNKMDEAMELYNTIRSAEPDFAVDDSKIIRLITLLVKNDRFNDAIKIIETQPTDRKLEDRSFSYNSVCWRLLNSLAESKNVEQLKLMFDKLVSSNFIEISNVMLGPLIKIHILRDDLEEAVKQFEWCCQQHHSTPWKTELACRLIQKEDAASLQKITDLSTNIHGEVNSLYDLVFAFVECGRIRQARKILETPGLRSRPHRMNTACERYLQEGMVQPLEGLVEATKDLTYIDRSDIYYNLLSSYCNSNDTDKALGLWTKMQEEDLPPTKEFLTKLGTYLQSKNLNVPFVIPKSTAKTSSFQPPEVEQQSNASVRSFHNALRLGDVDRALAIRRSLSSERTLSVNESSLLLEALLKHDRFKESSHIILEMLDKGTHPLPRIFRFSLNKFALNGDIAFLQKLDERLSNEMKKLLSFDNRLCHAYICAGKAEGYLEKLDKMIDEAKDADLEQLEVRFPRGAANGILENHPELTEKYEKIAIKYANRGIDSPVNILWMHYFIKGNDESAEKLWSNHLSQSPRLMFQRIIKQARTTEDLNLVDKLEKIVKMTKASEVALGLIFSCKLDILTAKEKYQEALDYLKISLDEVCLEHFNRSALLRLRDGLKAQDKAFPYEIPKRSSKNSSSSSSDEESDTKK